MNEFVNRRRFLKKTSKTLVSVALFPVFVFDFTANDFFLGLEGSRKRNSHSNPACEFGVEGSAPQKLDKLDAFLRAIGELGAGFIVCQFSPEFRTSPTKAVTEFWEASEKGFNDFALACRKYNLTFYANQEVTNYSLEGDILDKYGKDILAHPDKTHRWDITGKKLNEALKNPEFRGVVYDEAEHGQLRRGLNTNEHGHGTGRIHPYFAITDGLSLEQAYNAVYTCAKDVADNYRNKGVIPMTEHVFPAMMFTFARAGFDIVTKFMKESIDPVYAAIAMGAARQYGTEFCVNPDMWGFDWSLRDHFPGHPVEEFRASLLYAYWIGATRIFVENIDGLIKSKSTNGITQFYPTEYGKVYQWFVKDYVPTHPRFYTFRDIRPKIAILRLDDTDWGQKDSRFTDNLYGAVNLHTIPETEAWFQIWNILTHGQIPEGTISFNSKIHNIAHDFFYPLKDVVVYDHLAGEKELKGIKLVFLTGILISPKTLDTVRKFVKNGGLCVCLSSLTPSEFNGKLGKISDGSGYWLFVKEFNSEEVLNTVAPFLGTPDEISYCIGEQRLMIKRGEDRNSIKIYLENIKDIAINSETTESARVW